MKLKIGGIMRYKIKDGVNVQDDIQSKIAERICIERPTLNAILCGRATCTKSVAWYIVYLHLKAKNEKIDDSKIEDYFERVK